MGTSLNIHAWTTMDELSWIDSRERSVDELLAIRNAVVLREYDPPCNKRLVIEGIDWRIRMLRGHRAVAG